MDTIANMLTTISNAAKAGKKSADIPYSRVKENIALVLKKNATIKDFRVSKAHPAKISLVLSDSTRLVKFIRRSKPGRRLYARAKHLLTRRGSMIVVSTPIGITTAREARKQNVGGEVLFEVRDE